MYYAPTKSPPLIDKRLQGRGNSFYRVDVFAVVVPLVQVVVHVLDPVVVLVETGHASGRDW